MKIVLIKNFSFTDVRVESIYQKYRDWYIADIDSMGIILALLNIVFFLYIDIISVTT